jgi:uncharacterized protein DUF5818
MEGWKMKKLAMALVASTILLGAAYASPKDQTFSGMITDRFCQKANSHEEMMKKHNATNVNDCMVACVKAGGKYVLFDAATKTIYLLDDQQKPEKFVGQKVKITGTYDQATDTLHVTDIQPAS